MKHNCTNCGRTLPMVYERKARYEGQWIYSRAGCTSLVEQRLTPADRRHVYLNWVDVQADDVSGIDHRCIACEEQVNERMGY